MASEGPKNKHKIGEVMARRIGNLLAAKKRGKAPSAFNDNFSADGEKSVAVTVDSQLTVKASNRKPKKPKSKKPTTTSPSKVGWKTLKRLVGGVNAGGDSKSEEFKAARSVKSTGSISPRKRIFSEDRAKLKDREGGELSAMSTRIRNQLDLAIRGRHDGVDALSLGQVRGSAQSQSPPAGRSEKNVRKGDPSVSFSFDPFHVSFTPLPTDHSPGDLIQTTIRSSSGKEQSELMLEGYIPGGGDRWTVILGQSESQKWATSPRQSGIAFRGTPSADLRSDSVDTDDDTAELTDDGSTNMPSHKLWDSMWGHTSPPPTPSHMQDDFESAVADDTEEDVLQLAAACSVPVDLDEDTFIIDGPEHFNSIRDLAMVPLQRRKFDTAQTIFEKMLQGLRESNDSKLEHVQGSTLHNMGIFHLCQSNFKEAERCFKDAVDIRTQCLSPNHPDVAVSLMRQGEAAFGLEKYDEALKAMRNAVNLSPAEDATRAKMLNNIGIIHFYRKKYSESLRAFTAALEIQRQWLDGPVRRESIVYDASITLGNMGRVFLQMQELEVAYSMFEEACLLQMTVFRKDHDLVLNSLENMALVLVKSELYNKASPLLRGLLRSLNARFGADHERTIETVGILAFVLVKEMELEESRSLLKRVLAWQKKSREVDVAQRKLVKEANAMVENLINGKASLWV